MIDQKILTTISQKFGITKQQAESAIYSQFEFTRNVIASGADEPIRLQYLGIFAVPSWRREWMQNRLDMLKQKKNVNSTE
jgi:nucleoid DNA-binding protein